MAWAIFNVESNWSRPNSRYSFNAHPSPDPQERPQDFIDYCVAKGWAKKVSSPSRDQKRALLSRKRAK
ncbi:hypothetical protein [Phyllobacterium lublinensis]|uniref:hypothetical protein n=1 Tax=Phyllobacterium lublinensis TaxID=2875708 RepID=UPI001CCFD5D4|nr:hypothetical protein [Phyllobacterium sp. 2063]MBZ9653546.1 hypothetical protein [Phyllobacterium sp. 2063]